LVGVVAGDHFYAVSLSWPPTKQGELLYLLRISQAVAGIAFCVFLDVESASGLIIAAVQLHLLRSRS
jgi:hypothetical protein